MRRAVALGLAAVLLVMAAASSAFAHSGTNVDEHLVSVVDHAPDGVTVSLAPDGSFVTVSATRQVIVLGYSGEPFVRIDGERAYTNAASLTTYDARGGVLTTIPADAGTGQVRWESASDAAALTWSDHRTHFADALPDAVMSDPRHSHLVASWSIPVELDGAADRIDGHVEWSPPEESVVATTLLCLGLVVVVVGGAALLAFPRRRREVV